MTQVRDYSLRSLFLVKTCQDSANMKPEAPVATETFKTFGKDTKVEEMAEDPSASKIPPEADPYHFASILDAGPLGDSQVDSLKQAYILVSNRNDRQQQEISNLRKHSRDVEDSNQKLKKARVELDKTISSYRGDTIKLQEKLDTTKRQLAEARNVHKSVEERLAETEHQMSTAIGQRETWKQKYEAEVRVKQEGVSSKNKLSVSQRQYKRKIEEASSQLGAARNASLEYQHECEDLRNQMQQVTLDFHNREKQFVDQVQPLILRNKGEGCRDRGSNGSVQTI